MSRLYSKLCMKKDGYMGFPQVELNFFAFTRIVDQGYQEEGPLLILLW